MFVELERDTLAGMDVRADSALLRCIVGQLALIDSFGKLVRTKKAGPVLSDIFLTQPLSLLGPPPSY